MSTANTAVYLYCIVRAAARPSIRRVPGGVPGAGGLTAHRLTASLWLVTADVPLDIYGPARLEPRLRDLDWVSQAAVAHERVIEHFAKSAPVIPMKLFTLFSSLDKALADLSARADDIRTVMRRITGAEEWGVRVFRRPDMVTGAAVPRAASGAEFLRAKKQARDAAATARTAVADAAELAFDRLRRLARDARVRGARQEPGSNPPILDAAFLVAARGRTRFKKEAQRQASALGRAGGDLIVSGPWPAYNFVTAEERR